VRQASLGCRLRRRARGRTGTEAEGPRACVTHFKRPVAARQNNRVRAGAEYDPVIITNAVVIGSLDAAGPRLGLGRQDFSRTINRLSDRRWRGPRTRVDIQPHG